MVPTMRKWPRPDPVGESFLVASYRSGRWGRFDGGGLVEKFEKEFARFHNAEYGLGVANATLGLLMAYMALDLEYGDWFIVPAYTFIATATAGIVIGLRPVFVDIDFETLTIDTSALAETLERDKDQRIKLVVPVHFAGNPAEMDQINILAKKHGAFVVEDAAQAQGSVYRGKRVGALGDVGVFSFQSSKLMTAGEGGVALTNSREVYEKMWSIMHAGRDPTGKWYEHIRVGLNLRMLEFQAAVLLPQLWGLEDMLRRLRESAKIIYEELEKTDPIHLHRYPSHIVSNYYFIPLSIEDKYLEKLSKEKIVSKMRDKGFWIVEGYQKPLNKQPAFAEKKWRLPYEEYVRQSLPNTEKACRATMWIPHPEMLEPEDYVIKYARTLKETVRELLS